ncbi:LINE-1 type transposase domain-containing protein 1 [Canis lupus dingo]|uniref:LINE-1 type transposase domain-containing protein 1 n=1 Tax=Canis lupus dingo TaxID=286419 RepID=UPI0018F4ABF2|nr:LINE-1 type transposase domain-containing protein 1 [Canis lupus dingo]XP_038521957.1 LINE-1 type transposase domain-containing protein 1 [Canis lupus familiaris]XP_038521958.1 LINE-1 type transposase domain-containing protein 1 [Canis lupus familiaris]XP_038521959.1 LINE-1 type transposase domain-containing protein 1 [Canis lupus familiaris]XP_048966308.1 LINE-1 type transposase domain-containing protein 1 [Canis lupus dingo]XP_048966309.1 LINE-1 type transposase domain-containing protein 
MSIAESEIVRLAKKQECSNHREGIQLLEDQEMAQVLDLKGKDVSAVMLMKFKGLMESLELMVEEIRESFKNDLMEILGVESKIPEVKNKNNTNTKKEWQQIKGSTTQKPCSVEKIEGANSDIVEDTENVASKRKEISELSSKLDKPEDYSVDQGKELSHDESQNDKVLESVEETRGNLDNTCEDCIILTEVTQENQEIGEDEQVKEKREEKIPQNLENKEKTLKASREDEGAVLRLTADFSSATLDVSKQWSNVFNILRENDFEPKVLCQVKLTFKCDGEVRTFSDMQSLSNFTSQKPFMNKLLKGVLPQNEKIKKGRSYGIQEKVEKTRLDSKNGAEGEVSDGLSFLFVKEVKVAEPEEVKNLEMPEEDSSELEDEEEEASGLEEEEEETSGLEEEEDTSELEEEVGNEALALEEEGEEEASVSYKKPASTFQCHSVVNTKYGVEEKNSNDLEIVLIEEVVEDSDPEEEEGSEWEMEVVLSWEEGEDSEVENIKTASQIEKKEASDGLKEIACDYLARDFEKKKLVKYQMVQKAQNKEETAMPRNQGIGTVCRTLRLASPSTSLELSPDKQKRHLSTNLSTPSGITKFLRKTEKGRHKTLQTDAQTSKETDLIQETEENFRRNIHTNFRELQEEVANIKNSLPEVLEISSIDVLNSRINILEERMDSLEDRIEEFSKDTMQMAKQIINKERSRDIEDRSRSSNIRLIGIPEKDNKENGAEEIINEIIEENFPELKDSSPAVVSAYRIPSKIDEKRLTPRHILVKFGNSSDKEKILKASRKREITYRGMRIRLTADLSLDTLDARSQWSNIIQILQAKGFTPRILYPAKLAFDFEGKMKTFFDTEEFTKFVSCTPSLKELLEDIL